MDMIYRMVVIAGLSLALSGNCFAADPVPLPCHPNCGPIDPCKMNPDKCKDKGGPIGTKTDTPAESQKKDKPQESDDPCKWCTPCSRTPGSECLKCCAK